jgi:GDP-L-fucose synthase
VWGSGNAEREFIYAEDIANAVKMIHEDNRDIPNTMIVSPCIQHKIGDIARLIADSLGFNGKIVFDTSAPEGILRKPTINKLFMQTYPDFKFTSIEEGIRKTCQHFERENVHAHVATRG